MATFCPTFEKPQKTKHVIRAHVTGTSQVPSGYQLEYKTMLGLRDISKDGYPWKPSGSVGFGKAFQKLGLRVGDVVEFEAMVDERGRITHPSKVRKGGAR